MCRQQCQVISDVTLAIPEAALNARPTEGCMEQIVTDDNIEPDCHTYGPMVVQQYLYREPAHVGDVKYRSVLPAMLDSVHDGVLVLDWHAPSSKWYHLACKAIRCSLMTIVSIP